MIESTANRLEYLSGTIPGLLIPIEEDSFSAIPAPGKWSKKEILGHLIDSAVNNHQRFVRTQIEDTPEIAYDQDQWNQASRYNQLDSHNLIKFWAAYNLHLSNMIRKIPEPHLARLCDVGKGQIVTLSWLIEDYLKHLEHHLRQLVAYE